MSKKYDLFVIGAGSGGVRAARIAASHGAKVAIAEEKYFGGTCVNVGCVPKKLLAYASDFKSNFEDAKNYGWSIGKSNFNWKTLIKNKDTEIKRLNSIYKDLLTKSGTDIFEGKAKFIDHNTIEINGKKIKADKILIATGGRPVLPDILGKEHLISSDEAFYLPELPKRSVIIGGGYIGVEFAHILSGMGSQVTLIHRGDNLLRGFDKDISQTLCEEMNKQKGLDLKLSTDIAKIEKKGQEYIVHTKNGEMIKCDVILAATGRSPNTQNLGLENTKVKLDKKGRVEVDDLYCTDVPNIYALGDVSNNHNLTPVALAEGHVLADRLFAKLLGRTVSYEFIPTAVFSSPPISTVGLTEDQAKDNGIDINIYISKFTPLIHTISGRDEKTMMKMIVDKKTDQVLGLHMVGKDAPEIMQGFALALNLGAKKSDFDRTIGIHPSAAEEWVTMRNLHKPK